METIRPNSKTLISSLRILFMQNANGYGRSSFIPNCDRCVGESGRRTFDKSLWARRLNQCFGRVSFLMLLSSTVHLNFRTYVDC